VAVNNTLSTFEYYVAEHTDNGISRIPERVAQDAVLSLERAGRQQAAFAALREALDAYQERACAVGSCGDGGCVVLRPIGMHTNGGCRCSTDRMKAGRMMMAGQTLAAAVSAALHPTQQPPHAGETL